MGWGTRLQYQLNTPSLPQWANLVGEDITTAAILGTVGKEGVKKGGFQGKKSHVQEFDVL